MRFQAIACRTGPGILGFRDCWDMFIVHHLPLRLFGAYPFILLHLPLNFIRVSSLKLMYQRPLINPSLTHFCGWVSRLGIGFGTRCCGPRGGAGVRTKQKSRFKFLPWPGLNLGPCSLMAAKVTARLRRTPLFTIEHYNVVERGYINQILQSIDAKIVVHRNEKKR